MNRMASNADEAQSHLKQIVVTCKTTQTKYTVTREQNTKEAAAINHYGSY